MLDLVEKALDEIAFAIESEICFTRVLAIGFRRDYWLDATLVERFDESVAVVALVGKQGFRLHFLEERPGLRDIGGLSRRQRQRDRIAEGIDNGMNLRGQPTA